MKSQARSLSALKAFLRTSIVLCAALLASCATEREVKSAPELFEEAVTKQASADFDGAAAIYQEVQANFPFSSYAQQSELNLAHMYYESNEYEKSLSTINRFISSYPAHKNIDYARYLRALALQRERPDILDKILFEDYENHSRANALVAYLAFNEIVELHPFSRFAPDAIERANSIINTLVNGEISTAIHYMRIGAYSASLRRGGEIVERYPNSKQVESAMAIIVASLVEMGADAPLADAQRALKESFPLSKLHEPATQGVGQLLSAMNEQPVRGDYFTRLIERENSRPPRPE